MRNPFDVIDARLSNIEDLLLDIKHGNTRENNFKDNRKISVEDFVMEHGDEISVRLRNILTGEWERSENWRKPIVGDIKKITKKVFKQWRHAGQYTWTEFEKLREITLNNRK
jgi:hypothetical protein